MKLAWMDKAACRGLPTAMFFPEDGGDSSLLREIKQLCQQCPVNEDCLEYGLNNFEHFGVWGGLTNTSLIKLRKKRGIIHRHNQFTKLWDSYEEIAESS